MMNLIINHKKYPVRLDNGITARALVELLPITLDMEELNGNEKFVYLAECLPSEPACPGTIHAGDIMLFGSNCLVVFYQTFRTRYAYSRIGRVEDAEELREALGKSDVRIIFE